MREWVNHWWAALLHPEEAGRVVLGQGTPPGFTWRLAALVIVSYGIYGFCMGIFRGLYPGIVSGLKLPFLYIFTLLICFPPLYVLNCILGPALRIRQVTRLLLLATSANAVALASYSPFALFFTLTTSKDGYQFLVLMHVVVFAIAGILSLIVIGLVFRGTARAAGKRLRISFLIAWGILYAAVGTQMSWILRPWIGAWNVEYTPLRPFGGSFIESVWALLQNAF